MSVLAPGGFDWDAGNRGKCQKHGITVEEIEGISFRSAAPRSRPEHSLAEQRYLAVGRNSAGRPMFVAFTLRVSEDVQLIRPVNARYMHE